MWLNATAFHSALPFKLSHYALGVNIKHIPTSLVAEWIVVRIVFAWSFRAVTAELVASLVIGRVRRATTGWPESVLGPSSPAWEWPCLRRLCEERWSTPSSCRLPRCYFWVTVWSCCAQNKNRTTSLRYQQMIQWFSLVLPCRRHVAIQPRGRGFQCNSFKEWPHDCPCMPPNKKGMGWRQGKKVKVFLPQGTASIPLHPAFQVLEIFNIWHASFDDRVCLQEHYKCQHVLQQLSELNTSRLSLHSWALNYDVFEKGGWVTQVVRGWCCATRWLASVCALFLCKCLEPFLTEQRSRSSRSSAYSCSTHVVACSCLTTNTFFGPPDIKQTFPAGCATSFSSSDPSEPLMYNLLLVARCLFVVRLFDWFELWRPLFLLIRASVVIGRPFHLCAQLSGASAACAINCFLGVSPS